MPIITTIYPNLGQNPHYKAKFAVFSHLNWVILVINTNSSPVCNPAERSEASVACCSGLGYQLDIAPRGFGYRKLRVA